MMYYCFFFQIAPRGEKTVTHTELWNSLPCNDKWETVHLLVQNSTAVRQNCKWEPIENAIFSAQTIYIYCKEVAITVGQLGSVYWYNRERVLVRQWNRYDSVLRTTDHTGIITCGPPVYCTVLVSRRSSNWSTTLKLALTQVLLATYV